MADPNQQEAIINNDMREKARHLRQEAFQLANYYFVFQGVIFTAYYTDPSKNKCNHRWIPITLSIVAGILNLVAIAKITWDYKKTLDDIDNHEAADEATGPRRFRTFYLCLCLILFVVFLVATLWGCWVMTAACPTDAKKKVNVNHNP